MSAANSRLKKPSMHFTSPNTSADVMNRARMPQRDRTIIRRGLLDKSAGLALAVGCSVIVLVCLVMGLRLDAKS